MKLPKLPFLKHQSDFVSFTGGLDISTPPALVPSGYIRNSQNFEEDIIGGYQTITGFERFNGMTSPSNGQYSFLNYSSAGTVAIGNTITGATSGATAVVIAFTSTAFIVTKTTGVWVDENTTTLGAHITSIVNGETASQQGAQYLSLAADYYRSLISAVPGVGSVLGVWQYKGIVYAFRNTATTDVGMFKSSSIGWTRIVPGFEVYYSQSGIATQPAIGATITKGSTSGVLKGITVESGTWSYTGTGGGSYAKGRMIFASITTGPFTTGAFTAGITGFANVSVVAASTAITIPVQDGRFDFSNGNFYGTSDTLKMYGTDGKNRAFEFDGTTFIPINTGMGPTALNPSVTTTDNPAYNIVHQSSLIVSFDGSIQVSALGNPYNWTPLLGAAEIGCGDTITGFMPQAGTQSTASLAVYCRNLTYLLYGSSIADFSLKLFNANGGGIAYTMQQIGQTYVLDDRGVTSLSTVQNFGNFIESTISKRVKAWLQLKRKSIPSDSHIARDKQQYRIFFKDGSAAYWTIGAEIQSMMPIQFPQDVNGMQIYVNCSCSAETYGGGDELIYFGSPNGFVYQMERGTSFDGLPIGANLSLVFNSSKLYRFLKKYRRLTFEMIGTGYAEFFSTYDLNYGLSETAQPNPISNVINLTISYWDSFVWDSFIWDGTPLANMSMSIDGSAQNIAITIKSNQNYFAPVKFTGVNIEYTPLRYLR